MQLKENKTKQPQSSPLPRAAGGTLRHRGGLLLVLCAHGDSAARQKGLGTGEVPHGTAEAAGSLAALIKGIKPTRLFAHAPAAVQPRGRAVWLAPSPSLWDGADPPCPGFPKHLGLGLRGTAPTAGASGLETASPVKMKCWIS